MGRIGIYGGTFNPPHLGHMQAVREFAKQLNLDRVLMIPAAVPPHKALPAGSPDAETRLHLCRLAAADLPFVEVSDLELTRSGKSYTAVTVQELHRLYPEDELVLLMGTDMFLTFDQWREPKTIAGLATLAMVHRENPDKKEREVIADQRKKLKRKFGAKVTVLENDILEMSSTSVRQLLAFGAGETLLPPAVYEEILRLGLYRTGENFRNLPFEALKEASLSLHKPKRVSHAVGCCETAQALAERWGESVEDAARAGILHDVTKILDGPEQLILCREYGILLDDFYRRNGRLLHAVTGAAVAARLFGESAKVADAIRWHTTGKPDMTTFEKIIYLADMIEPNRDFPGVEKLRKLAMKDLDETMLLTLERSVEFVEAGGNLLHPDSVHALEWQRDHMEQPLCGDGTMR